MIIKNIIFGLISCVNCFSQINSCHLTTEDIKREAKVDYKEATNKSLISFKNIGYVDLGSAANVEFILNFDAINEFEVYLAVNDGYNTIKLEENYYDRNNNIGYFSIEYFQKIDSFVCSFTFSKVDDETNVILDSQLLYCSCYDEMLIYNDLSFEQNDVEYRAYKKNYKVMPSTNHRKLYVKEDSSSYGSTVSLNVLWTDAKGYTHPAYGLRVVLQRATSFFGMFEYVSEGYLNEDGHIDLTYSYSDHDEIRFLIYLATRAAAPLNVFDNTFETDSLTVSFGRPLTFPTYTIGNVSDKEKKLSIVQALTWAHKYLENLTGEEIRGISYSFPCNSTFFIPYLEVIDLVDGDYCDWDVIIHEYGHFVEYYIDFGRGSYDQHSGDQSLSESRKDFKGGVEAAWFEGFATYFSMSCQNEMNLRRLNIISQSGKNEIGDSIYSDTGDNNINADFKSVNIARLGEGCERTICAYLLGLADSDIVPSIKDNLNYGYRSVWDVVVDYRPNNLGEFVTKFHERYPYNYINIGDFESFLNLGPTLITNASFDFKSREFKWTIWNANGEFSQNNFVLYFYNYRFEKIFSTTTLAINKGGSYSYKLSKDECGMLLKSNSKSFYWRVEACSNYDGYITKYFYSNAGSFKIDEIIKIMPSTYGFEQQYFFYQKSKDISLNGLSIKTKRLRTGFIEGQYVVLSAYRQSAGIAYLELDIGRQINAIKVDVCLWSGNEQFGILDSINIESYNKTSLTWRVEADLLRTISLSCSRDKPNVVSVVFNNPVDKIRFFVECNSSKGDRNKGRLCIGALHVY